MSTSSNEEVPDPIVDEIISPLRAMLNKTLSKGATGRKILEDERLSNKKVKSIRPAKIAISRD